MFTTVASIWDNMSGMKRQLRFLMLCVALVGITFPASSLLFGQTVTPATPSYSFGSINVCPSGKTAPAPCSATHTVSFNIPAGTTIGGIDIVLGGATSLDYKAKADDTSTTLCTAKLYSEATTCTVDITFAPALPGGRVTARSNCSAAPVRCSPQPMSPASESARKSLLVLRRRAFTLSSAAPFTPPST